MATTGHTQQPTPERLFNALNGYQQTEAIKAAIKLEIFTAVGEGCATAAAIAQEMTKSGKVKKVLDIAAGHGIFGITVAQHNPEAHIYAADWPKVLEVAAQNAKAAGVAARHHLIAGSAFDTEFGGGYDLVLI